MNSENFTFLLKYEVKWIFKIVFVLFLTNQGKGQEGASVSLPAGMEVNDAKGLYVAESVRSGDTIKFISQGADVHGVSRSDRRISIYSIKQSKILETNLIDIAKKSMNGKKTIYFSGRMILSKEKQGVIYAVADSTFKGFDFYIQEIDLKGVAFSLPIKLFNFPQRIALSSKMDFLHVSKSEDNSKFLIHTHFSGISLQLQSMGFAVVDDNLSVLSTGLMPIKDGYQQFSFTNSAVSSYVSNTGKPFWLWHEEEKVKIARLEKDVAKVDSFPMQFDILKTGMTFNSLNEPLVFGFEADSRKYSAISSEVNISRAFSFKIGDRGEIEVSHSLIDRIIIKDDSLNGSIISEKNSEYPWLSVGLYNFDMGRINNVVHLLNGSTIVFVCSSGASKKGQQLLWFQIDGQGKMEQTNVLCFEAISDETASLMAIQRQHYFFYDEPIITYIQASRDQSQRVFEFSVDGGNCKLKRQSTLDSWRGDESMLSSDIVIAEDNRCFILVGTKKGPGIGNVELNKK